MKHYFLGDQCLIFSFGDQISKELNYQVISAYYALTDKAEFLNKWKIHDLVPSYNALAVHFFLDSSTNCQTLVEQVEAVILKTIKANKCLWLKDASQWEIEVSYSGADLKRVSEYVNLSEKEVVYLHTMPEYHIAMLGFVPFFPYLLGLNPKLEIPRRERPRVRVNKGSVAIGGNQTGIYSESSPGGWNIIGSTEFDAFKNLKPGDKLKFVKI